MASQLRRVTRNPALRTDQVAIMRSRLPGLVEMQRQKERQAAIEMQKQQFGQQMDVQRRGQRAEERAGEVGMGVSALGTGFSLASSDLGKRTLGSVPLLNKVPGVANKGFFSGTTAGSVLGGGMAGFGAGALVGGKGKKKLAKRLGAGILGGGIMGLFSGQGGGSPWGSAITGAATGGLGSYLKGLI
jgi:hypothetical protein